VSQLQTELPAKRLEVLKELLPKARRVGVLADVSTRGQLEVTQTAAQQFGIELLVHEFNRTPYDYPGAFANFARGKAEALLALTSGLFVPGRRTITSLALQHKLPSVFNNVLWIESGGLLSYGPNFSATYRRAAEQVAKVLNGANPADIPVEQPNVVEMAINLKTAKALGIAIPAAMQLRADRVVE
jgi:putative ABC transport system substrate-binding protein